jgi:DNA-directed RNA polymerase specialized sigma subunit
MYAQSIDIELLYEEHKHLIRSVIWKNRPLLAALRLEDEDVSQQLAIVMLSAIHRFDPERSASLVAHIRCSLQYEILNIKRRHKPHGVTGVPKGNRLDFQYLDNILSDGSTHELPVYDDTSRLDVSELLDSLTEQETEAVDRVMRGFRHRRKIHTAALEGVRRRYTLLYGNAGGAL